jgi:CDP-glycerol glycerophosphotransferase
MKSLLNAVMIRFFRVWFRVLGFFPPKKDLIIFESYLGKQYSSNPRAIYEYLREHHPHYRMVWSVNKAHIEKFQELGIPYAIRFSFKWLYLMPRARYWVTNTRMPQWLKKPNHTVYLQTWHGTPLKKLAADMAEVHMPGTTTEKYKEGFLKETQQWDYLISPNSYSSKIFQSAFRYKHSKILETGYPRNDDLVKKNKRANINKIKEKLKIPEHRKVILYAPTWRDDDYYEKGKYKFSLKLDLELLQRSLGEDYVLILRLHYLIANRIDVTGYEGFVVDFSSYDDIQELYLISDLLITDYSSVFFDYLCLKRPIIFYTYDIEKYRDQLRGFYFDFEKDAPGPLVKTTEEMIETIQQMGEEPSEGIQQFYQRFCSLEKGVSTKRVVNRVFLGRTAE